MCRAWQSGLAASRRPNAQFRDEKFDERAIKPGEPDASLVWERISSDDPDVVMPPAEDIRKLSPKQIAALRFASDDELGALLERAARRHLSDRDQLSILHR